MRVYLQCDFEVGSFNDFPFGTKFLICLLCLHAGGHHPISMPTSTSNSLP